MNRMRIVSGVLAFVSLLVLLWSAHALWAASAFTRADLGNWDPAVVAAEQARLVYVTQMAEYFPYVFASAIALYVFGLLALVPQIAPRMIAAMAFALVLVAAVIVVTAAGADGAGGLVWLAGCLAAAGALGGAVWSLAGVVTEASPT